ncbi:MAG: DUF1236 domain-containing protein [Bradyrhizobium sp.]|nr:DUF1236 domain-containing protein [Bradyrhizobium sp.]
MAETSRPYVWGIRHLFLGVAIIAAVLLIGIAVWPVVMQNPIGTPKGGANPATAPDITVARGAPAQQSAESTVGKNSSSGNDANGARAKDIKQSSQALQLNPQQRQQIKDVIARQTDAPRVAKAPFEMMIGTAVPREVPLKDIPAEISQVMNGFKGDQYVLVQDEMVIVDHDSRRVVAIVPAVA